MVKSKFGAFIEAFWEAFKETFPKARENIKIRLKAFFLFMICFFIAFAFIRLFLLLNENNYSEIIAYGEKVTVLIGALAGLTFAYAATFESPEKKDVREIGERFLKSFLYFVIGLILTIGLYGNLIKPIYLSVFPGSLLLFLLAQIIIFIFFWTGFVMLIISAVYLGIGIYKLNDYGSKAKYG